MQQNLVKKKTEGEDGDEIDELEALQGGEQFVKNTKKKAFPEKKLNKAALKKQYRQHGFAILDNDKWSEDRFIDSPTPQACTSFVRWISISFFESICIDELEA